VRSLVVKKKIMEIDGKQVEVEVFETELIPGKNEDEAIAGLLREDEIEKAVLETLPQLENLWKEYAHRERGVMYYYEMGKVLQFVDKRKFQSERAKIWRRIAKDLKPVYFFGKEQAPQEDKIARYPETMYLLSKQPVEDVRKVTWSHWFEILQYPRIRENRRLVRKLLDECAEDALSSQQLRRKVQELNRKLAKKETAAR
jgi:hypothetical protein